MKIFFILLISLIILDLFILAVLFAGKKKLDIRRRDVSISGDLS